VTPHSFLFNEQRLTWRLALIENVYLKSILIWSGFFDKLRSKESTVDIIWVFGNPD
jgi:hypothetical protein